MKKHLLKSMLVMAMMALGANAWAGEKTVVKYSFDDAMSPALTAGSNASLDYTRTSVISKTPFLNIWGANSSNGATNITLGDQDLSAETWTLQFDWAGYSGCNKKTGHTYLKAGDTNLFDIVDAADWGKTFTLNYGESSTTINVAACNKSTRISAKVADDYNKADYWLHFTIVGSAEGVKLTIAPSNGGDAVLTDALLSAANVNPTMIAINPGSCGGVGIDELLLTYYVEGEVIQTPIAAYTKVDGIKRVITATCDTEGATIQYSLDGESWTDGAEVTVAESGKVYFKAVKGTSESDVLTFDAVAGEEIVLNTPLINRTSDTSVTITADQSMLLLSPDATIYYTYGEESGSFVGSKTLTVAADAVITAYAEFEGYATSETAERAVALFPKYVKKTENTASKTSGWSENAFSTETVTVSERTYAALLLDEVQWGTNIYLQTTGAWGLRANGNWYINSNTEESWLLMQNMKKGDIIVVDATYPASSMVNATYSKYAFGTKHAYEVTEDGNVELALKKIDAKAMDYFYGVYAYTAMSDEEIALIDAQDALKAAIAEAKAIEYKVTTTDPETGEPTTEYKNGGKDLEDAITAAEKALAAENATAESLNAAKAALDNAVIEFKDANFEAADCTAKVDVNAWKSEQGNVGNYTKDVAQKEQYLTNTTTVNGDVLYQVVEGLDNGTYSVELYANASYTSGRGFASAALDGEVGRVVVYAGDVEKTIPVVYQTAVGTNNIVKLDNVVVSDGTLKMGLRKLAEGSNWHTIQIKALTQTGIKAKADAAAQDEYWKGIAATVAAYEAYKNVAGAEKAAIAAASTKDAAEAAIPAFYAAKAGYDALAEIIAKAKSIEYDVTEAEALMAAAETTAADAAAKAEELVHPINLAVNTKAVEGASTENPIETNFVVNGTFDTNGNVAPWKATGGFQNQTTANNQQGAFTGNFFENWNGSAKVNKMYQEIEDIPNGKYTLKICAFVNTFDANTQYVFANNDHTALTAGEPTAYEVSTIVANNKIEIGLEQTAATANWMGIDNVSLVYYGETNIDELVAVYEKALADANAIKGNMNSDDKAALDAAIATEVDKTNADALTEATAALTTAIQNAQASVAAYAAAAEKLPKMKELTEQTNVYTEQAYEEYYNQWVVKYDANTLTTAEANALQDPFIVTGWRASVTCDNFLLSAWDTSADFANEAAYYINTWSTEGNNDGSEFKVPFFEYWTGDGNSLGEKTLTATMNDLKAGVYDVNAWVRVRIKNGAETPATGITLQANEGVEVDVTAGSQIGTSQFYLDHFTAQGTVEEDGVLKIKFNIAAGNNISWLSFKNVKFEFNSEATGINSVNSEAQNVEGIYNLAGQKVQKAQKGLFIINGKKVVK